MVDYTFSPVACRDPHYAAYAWNVWDNKVKPQLSLGRLEHLAVDIACMRRSEYPVLGTPILIVACADHGVVAESVTGSPRDITWQQCCNFSRHGGAVGLMCRLNDIDLSVVDVGVAHDFEPEVKIIRKKIAYGTNNIATGPAMNERQCIAALEVGRSLVAKQAKHGRAVVIFGEMGVGNTTSAAALMSALTHIPVGQCAGKGSGLHEQQLLHKIAVIERAIEINAPYQGPLDILMKLGGFEIACMVGGFAEAAARNMVILVDGFIATIAAYIATLLVDHVQDYFIFSHVSKERGHRVLLETMHAKPLLDLEMCLGEGTGAALAWLVVRQSMELYHRMESFDDAKVINSVALLKSHGVDAHA